MRPKALSGSIAKYSRGLVLSALALIGASQAPGATYYWDTDGSGTPGFGTASGTWGTSAFWGASDLGTGATANTTITTSDTINFGTATVGLGAGAIGVNGTVNVNNIVFGGASGYLQLGTTAAGGTITLGGTTPTITVNNGSDQINAVLAGNSGLIKDGGGTLILIDSSKTYTGTTTVSAGTLMWTANGGGSNTGSTAYILNGSSSLVIDNTGGNRVGNDDRINNGATIALNGGSFTYIGSGANQQFINETVGAISGTGSSATAGSSITVTAPSSGGLNIQTTLTAASFTHSPGNASILLNGARLGQDTLTINVTGVPRFILNTAPTLVGTTSALSTGNGTNGLGLGAAKDTKIVPFLVGEATSTTGGLGTATGTPNTFLTYNSGTGLRPLNPTDEFSATLVTGNNVRLTGDTTTGGTSTSINSVIVANTSTTALTITDGDTVTVASGTILFPNTATIRASSFTGVLAFGSAEGMVRVNSGLTGTISAVVTGSAGLTQSGLGGTLVLSGANSYTGTTTVSGGTTLNIRNNSALGSNTATTVASGGKLQLQGGITVGSGTTLTISQPTVSTFTYSSITNGTATTGTATSSGVYNLLTFTSIASSGTSASLNVTSAGNIEYLVVGGGGGGGYSGGNVGGGGGAGGFRTNVAGNVSGGNSATEAPLTVATGTTTVTVGAGGAVGANAVPGSNGGNSAFGSIISLGGGGGGSRGGTTAALVNGQGGGSGGGAASKEDSQTPYGVGGAGTSGQGFNGGNYTNGGDNGGGGGGGASGIGGTNQVGGTGGAGLTSTITGAPVMLAGGGGGGHFNGGAIAGGAGGGGNGGGGNINATAGTANTGGGGGGGGRNNSAGGGGSGTVILRYVGAALENVSGDNTFNGAITLGSYIGISSLANTLTLGGAIGDSGSGYGITKLGAGTVVLSGTNGYTGTTTMSAGTLELQGSLSGTTAVTVSTGGTLLLNSAASDIVKTTATVAMAGGTLAFGNAANQTQTLGAMTLTANSILDFGASGGNDKFLFAGFSHTAGTTLAINNWVGNAAGGTDGANDRLVFSGLASDFTSSFSQAQISFNGASGYAAINFGGTYEIVPVPEPATTALIGSIALCALIGYRERRRFTGFGKRMAARK